jgi:hypothetical protein
LIAGMDPVSAIGLAAAAVQFVSFASQLITSTAEIHRSAAGASADIASIEQSYQKLGRLSLDLSDASSKAQASIAPGSTITPKWDFRRNIPGENVLSQDLSLGLLTPQDLSPSLRDLLKSCKQDCDSILAVVEKVKAAKQSSSRWASFRSAVEAHCQKGTIDEIEKRLARTQKLVALEMSRISK